MTLEWHKCPIAGTQLNKIVIGYRLFDNFPIRTAYSHVNYLISRRQENQSKRRILSNIGFAL